MFTARQREYRCYQSLKKIAEALEFIACLQHDSESTASTSLKKNAEALEFIACLQQDSESTASTSQKLPRFQNSLHVYSKTVGIPLPPVINNWQGHSLANYGHSLAT